jgi:hypothetical protein
MKDILVGDKKGWKKNLASFGEKVGVEVLLSADWKV